jgi:hypothetical protein
MAMSARDSTLIEQAEEPISPQKFSHPLAWLLYSFLQLYVKERDEKHGQMLERLTHTVQSYLSIITRTDPVIDQLKDIVERINKDIENAKTFEEFYKLSFKLRIYAQEAQAQKSILSQVLKSSAADTYSLLHDTCYALAGLTICYLALDESFSKRFNEKINELLTELKIKEQNSLSWQETRRGKGVLENDEAINKIILELAQLGHKESLRQALRLKLLPPSQNVLPDTKEMKEFDCADAANENLPLRLQSKFFLWAYSRKLRKVSQNAFKHFFDDRIKEYKDVHEKQSQSIERPREPGDQDQIIEQNSLYISIRPDEFIKETHPKMSVSSQVETAAKMEARSKAPEPSPSLVAAVSMNSESTRFAEADEKAKLETRRKEVERFKAQQAEEKRRTGEKQRAVEASSADEPLHDDKVPAPQDGVDRRINLSGSAHVQLSVFVPPAQVEDADQDAEKDLQAPSLNQQ